MRDEKKVPKTTPGTLDDWPDLRRAVDELPRELEPRRDHWPAIRARLEPRASEPRASEPRASEVSDAGTVAAEGRVLAGPWRPTPKILALQAVAALFFMALGALLTWTLAVGPMSGLAPDVASGEAGAHALASSTAGMPAAIPAAADVGTGTYAGWAEAEGDYLRAKEALWIQVMSHHDRLSPVTLEVVERNLGIIDRAIHDLRRALAADPGNTQLEKMLIDNHQRSLDLLWRLAKEV